MKIPNFVPPNEIAHPDLPEEAYGAMNVLSAQIEKLTTALQKNMSPEDNENAETVVSSFLNDTEHDIFLQSIKGKPSEVRVLDHDLFERVDVAWQIKDRTVITVKLSWPSQPTGPVNATLLVRGASDGDY